MPEPDDTVAEMTQREVVAGTSAYSGQMKVAAVLEEALASIRAYARTNDYFVGYSLTEVIEDQLEVIGSDDTKDDETNTFVPGTLATRTKISQVNHIWNLLLGTDQGMTEGAIGVAKNAETVGDLINSADEGSTGI